ncbi:MAG: MmgE/PrpD family protein [Candidatus Krumholzibacteria bacterium]|nr:MmgE/PrpD family protein [Candidatus Krumholzibacteria bacterium]
MATMTETLAEFTVNLTYDQIPEDARAAAKRFIFDSVGCALGGLKQEDTKMYRRVLRFLGGNDHATIIGTGEKASLVQAALINSLLIRVMDYNDIYWMQDPSHPSDIIPAALSTGEYAGKNGADVLTAVIIAYEIEMRLCEFAIPGIRERGWHHATLTQFASPYAAGKMLDLDVAQLVNAAGISGSSHSSTGSVSAGKLTMMKNTVDPLANAAGVEAALLAREGYTGPEHAIDGKEGLMHCLGEGWDESKMTDGLGDSFKITQCGMKAHPTEALTHAPITATLGLIRTHKLQPEDIASVEVKTISRAADILSDPSKYDPQSKETADHSLPYCLAAACARGKVTPHEFEDASIQDPAIRKFLPLIKVSAEPEYEALFPQKQPNLVRIHTTGGQTFEEYVEYPKGHAAMPMDKDDLIVKFAALAAPELSQEKVDEIYDLIDRFDDLETMQPLFDAIKTQ